MRIDQRVQYDGASRIDSFGRPMVRCLISKIVLPSTSAFTNIPNSESIHNFFFSRPVRSFSRIRVERPSMVSTPAGCRPASPIWRRIAADSLNGSPQFPCVNAPERQLGVSEIVPCSDVDDPRN